MAAEDACHTCVFYQIQTESKNQGLCRRYPPLRVAGAHSAYPWVPHDFWCGEFKKGTPTAATLSVPTPAPLDG